MPVQRQLRREANYGCVLCGCPIIDNAHIVPYEATHEFQPDDMLILCPTCHRRADKGNYSEAYLREAKKNPHNRVRVKDSFQIEGSDLIVNIDDIQFKNTPRVLVLNDFDIIAINRIEGRFLSLDINFYDRLDNHIAIVLENNWFVDTRLVWDVEYKPQHLIIRNEPRKISFEARIENGEVFLRGEMYYRGHQISLTDEAFMIPSRNIRLSGFSIVDFPVGISEQV